MKLSELQRETQDKVKYIYEICMLTHLRALLICKYLMLILSPDEFIRVFKILSEEGECILHPHRGLTFNSLK